MNGLNRLKKLEAIHADAINPVYHIMIVENHLPLEYMIVPPIEYDANGRGVAMNEEQYLEWKEKTEKRGITIDEWRIQV